MAERLICGTGKGECLIGVKRWVVGGTSIVDGSRSVGDGRSTMDVWMVEVSSSKKYGGCAADWDASAWSIKKPKYFNETLWS